MSKIFFKSQLFKNKNNTLNKQDMENGFNVLENKDKINEPNPRNINQDIFMINKNQIIMEKIQKKSIMTEKDVKLIDNRGEGKCFYKAISQFYYLTEEYHIYYRKILAELIDSKKQTDAIEYPYIYKNPNNIFTFLEYFNELIFTGNYAGQYEIINTSIILNCNIVIYKNENLNTNSKDYNLEYETIINKYDEFINPFKPIILLAWINNNHYILLIPNNINIDFKNYVNKKFKKINLFKKNNKNDTSENENKSDINEDVKTDQNIIEDENISHNYKDYLMNYITNDESIYPELKGTKNGKKKLQDILNYLLSGKNNQKTKIWPKYIIDSEIHNKKIKGEGIKIKGVNNSIKKERIHRGRSNTGLQYNSDEIINIKNLKKEFRKSTKNYILSNKNELA